MKKIKLTQGKFTLVDNADFKWLNQWKWWYGHRGYAIRYKKGKIIRMHRLILNTPKELEGEHKNGNGLDNQRHNLRIATHAENSRNVKKRIGKNGKQELDLTENKFILVYSPKNIMPLWLMTSGLKIYLENLQN